MESIGVRPSYDFLTMNLHFLKGRKLLITAGVYESEVAEKVQDTFEKYRETQSYKEAILSTANTLQLSKASVTSYLPYQKGVYSRVQQIKRKSVLEQSGSGDTER